MANSLKGGSVNREPLFAGCLLLGNWGVVWAPDIRPREWTASSYPRNKQVWWIADDMCQAVIILILSVYGVSSFAGCKVSNLSMQHHNLTFGGLQTHTAWLPLAPAKTQCFQIFPWRAPSVPALTETLTNHVPTSTWVGSGHETTYHITRTGSGPHVILLSSDRSRDILTL